MSPANAAALRPAGLFDAEAAVRFDHWSLARFDAVLSARAGGLTGSLDFGRYAAQPLLGWAFPREGVTTTASYKFANGFSVNGTVGIDMSRHFYDTGYGSRLYPTNFNLGVGYEANNCTTLKVDLRLDLQRADQHRSRRSGAAGDPRPDRAVRTRR